MGEEDQTGDAQKIKRIAAAAYDYENDPKWADYWSNILIPPHMASRSDVVDHFKRKFYQRYIDPGLIVEPMSLTGTSQPTRQTSSSSTSTPTSDQARPRNSGTTTRTSGSGTSTTPGTGATPTAMRWDKQTIQFSVNAWVCKLVRLVNLCLSWLCFQSFLSSQQVCQTGLIAYLYWALLARHYIRCTHFMGQIPRAWNMQAAQMWLQSVLATKDFIYFIYSLMFVTTNVCLRFALIPILCRSLEHVAKFLRRNFSTSNLYRKYLEEPCVWVESNVTTLSILSSHAEVGLGFLLIISLFSWQRNFIQIFMYWQLLKLMYHAPVTAGYHQSVWTKIGRSVNPGIQRYAPFLNTPLSFIQKWWVR
ncbi:RNA pyrophosphohydrolase [Bienertia sinuspersici]